MQRNIATLTIEIPDDLMERLDPIRDQLPALLRRCFQPEESQELDEYERFENLTILLKAGNLPYLGNGTAA